MDEERIRPSEWLRSVRLLQCFSIVGWVTWKIPLTHKKPPVPLIFKVLFWNKWSKKPTRNKQSQVHLEDCQLNEVGSHYCWQQASYLSFGDIHSQENSASSLKNLKFNEACAAMYLVDLFDDFVLIRLDKALRWGKVNNVTQSRNTILQCSTHVLQTNRPIQLPTPSHIHILTGSMAIFNCYK